MQISEGLPYRISTKMWKDLWHTSRTPFMALCKLGLIMDQRGITR
jgi:hypothetical protein